MNNLYIISVIHVWGNTYLSDSAKQLLSEGYSIACQFRFPAFCALNLALSCFANAVNMYKAINYILVSETKGQEGTMTVK